MAGNHGWKLAGKTVFADAGESAAASALLFSSRGENWHGGVFNRFCLREMPADFYCYQGHLLALPRAGEGRLSWRHDGRSGVAPVCPGLVSIQPAGRFLHRCEMRDVVCDTINLDPEWLQGLLGEEAQRTDADLKALPSGEDRLLSHWLNLLIACVPLRGERGAKLAAEEILVRLGVHLLQRHGTHPAKVRDYKGGLAPWRLHRVFDFVEDHSAESISLAELAEAAGGVSVYYFCRLFLASTGFTPHQYVRKSRLARARSLLDDGRHDLLEVAMATGFSDHSHLTRCFKRQFGITPSDFRARGKNSKIVQTE